MTLFSSGTAYETVVLSLPHSVLGIMLTVVAGSTQIETRTTTSSVTPP